VTELRRNSLGVLMRQAIPLSTKRELWAIPCVVCGVPWSICIDHIVPVAQGGGSERSNLQSLCVDCNHAKSHKHTTGYLFGWVVGRGPRHFLGAIHREAVRHINSFDRPSVDRWASSHPEATHAADRMYLTFLDRVSAMGEEEHA
jgi:hypothetical protein